jgi:hypothetical protein
LQLLNALRREKLVFQLDSLNLQKFGFRRSNDGFALKPYAMPQRDRLFRIQQNRPQIGVTGLLRAVRILINDPQVKQCANIFGIRDQRLVQDIFGLTVVSSLELAVSFVGRITTLKKGCTSGKGQSKNRKQYKFLDGVPNEFYSARTSFWCWSFSIQQIHSSSL